MTEYDRLKAQKDRLLRKQRSALVAERDLWKKRAHSACDAMRRCRVRERDVKDGIGRALSLLSESKKFGKNIFEVQELYNEALPLLRALTAHAPDGGFDRHMASLERFCEEAEARAGAPGEDSAARRDHAVRSGGTPDGRPARRDHRLLPPRSGDRPAGGRGVKITELKPCGGCGGPVAPAFFAVEVRQHVVNPEAVNQILGLNQMFGGNALGLAEVFSSHDSVTEEPGGPVQVILCSACFSASGIVAQKWGGD